MAHPHPLTRRLTWEEAFEGELEGGAWLGELEAVTSQNGRQSHSSHTLTHSFCPTLSLSPHAFTLLSALSSYSFSLHSLNHPLYSFSPPHFSTTASFTLSLSLEPSSTLSIYTLPL